MKPGAFTVGAACAWELVALTTGRVPTWSALTRALPRPRRACVLAVFTGWLIAHMGPWRVQ